MPEPTPDLYIFMLGYFSPTQRVELDATSQKIAGARIDPSDADQWETLGWIFADRVRGIAKRDGSDKAIVAIGIAGSMFARAEQLREPPSRQ